MLKISTLTLVALLSLGVTTLGTTTAANATVNCPRTSPDCPPPGGGNNPDPDPYVPPPGGNIDMKYNLALDCAVKNEEPSTDDFFLLNIGSAELPAGLKIRFEIPSTGERGVFLLPRSLAPGQKALIPGLLKAVLSDTECRAMVVT